MMSMRFHRLTRARALLALGTLLLAAAAALLVLVLLGTFDTHAYSRPDTGTAFNVGSLLQSGTPVAEPAGGPAVTHLRIPRIGVDAHVITKGIDASGVMQVPDNAHDVAWYDFAARPGSGGNIVLSGHVDFHGVGPAVFWDLGKLEEGDAIDVEAADGATYAYHVVGKGTFDAASAPVSQIVGPTAVESVTIITCTGVFNQSTHQYNKRLVVRAERDASQPAPTAPAGR
jgi:LPXTG-site transpeptidase (sortase) family protein